MLKTFKDLKFIPHLAGNGLMASLFFPNGYGISVVRFKTFGTYGSYTSNEEEWEAAVLIGNEEKSSLCYTTEITKDVIGHLSETQVTEIMEQIQKLQPETSASTKLKVCAIK